MGNIENAASWINETIYVIGGYHVFQDGTERSSDHVHRFEGAVLIEDFNKNIPMDLRGIANIDDSLKYLIGGITKGQRTSQDLIKLEWKE